MPRIDPLSLLKCLSLLLSPDGGINSREEVPRFVNLMTKFSKRLVSKCVYLLILKSTDVSLLDMFMTSGGWLLIQTWLQEAMSNSNWDLVQEVLELLLMTPVDSTRLRLNNIPKLVKTLSKREDLGDVKEMATSLVNNWLAIVKNSTINQEEKSSETSPEACNNAVDEVKKEIVAELPASEPPIKSPVVTNEIETIELQEAPIEEPVKMEVEDENTISTSMFYKITIRDGKQVLTKLTNSEEADEKPVKELSETPEDADTKNTEQKSEDGNKVENKKESRSKSSSKSSSSSSRKDSSSSKSSSSSKDKKHTSKHSSRSSSSSSKDKSKKENEKDKHRSNGSSKHSSSNEKSKSSSSSSTRSKDKKESKEKQAEKDKDTLEKVKPATIDKIGRIPKKPSSDEKEVKKKPTMSIEPKKKGEDRPKTVKIFNSKMRSTGLEEEVKPPPPRSAIKKPPPVIPPITLPTKRPSPPKETLPAPPEKKIKLDIPERIGAIKLIPPKPKPAFLQESDIFMDALTAATSKKEPKKKKRRLSQSKEAEETNSSVQQTSPTPIGIKNYSPANFYQETLNNSSENEAAKEDKPDEPMEEGTSEETTKEVTSDVTEGKTECADITEVNEPSTRTNSDGLKGALVYFKKKGPKRSLRWRDDKDLVEIRYFELDETERVNVSRPNFTELAKLDMTHEREALLGRKLNNEDLMEPTTMWRIPYIVDQPDLPVQPGSKSLEKDIQYARSKNTLQALYFNKNTIPDTPGEPIPEIHPMVDPVSIPLEDAESQICDLRNTPWPEPKGLAPVEQAPVNIPPMFQNIPGPFPNFPQMGPPGFPGMQGPRFGPPNMMPNGPPNMMPNNINMMGNPNMNMVPPIDMINQVPMNQVPMNQGPMNPNMFGPNMDSFNPMMNENQNYPIPFNQQNMYGPPNNNFNNMERGGGHRGRGAFRRGHNNWNRNVPRGGSSWRGNGDHRGSRICKNVKNHGYCRKIDTCPFIHPN